MREPREVVKHPLVTEKSSAIKDTGWYVFAVDGRANKKEIKESVEKLFKVKVDRVRTLVLAGKSVKKFGRISGKRSPLKKAYVKLKEGKIEFFEGV
ncbi:MAG TPA: 50S ribosomal protein L23 [Thermodesulfobacteriota bacterium]|nr:50S ribosomal protein L23 [Thermodesulfobacteriota bacterium]